MCDAGDRRLVESSLDSTHPKAYSPPLAERYDATELTDLLHGGDIDLSDVTGARAFVLAAQLFRQPGLRTNPKLLDPKLLDHLAHHLIRRPSLSSSE